MFKMVKNPYAKNILSALVVAVVGFVLLNLTFLFYALVSSAFEKVFPIDLAEIDPGINWIFLIRHIAFVVIIAVISWFVLRSKLGDIYKATYLTVPAGVTFATVGILLYRWPAISYAVGIIIFGASIAYLLKKKKPWIYIYSVIIVALAMLVMALTGTDI